MKPKVVQKRSEYTKAGVLRQKPGPRAKGVTAAPKAKAPVAEPKRRGRPPKAVAAAPVAPKKRGRPPKLAASNAATPVKRGNLTKAGLPRQKPGRKAKGSAAVFDDRSTPRSVNNLTEPSDAPKKRGRPRKNILPLSEPSKARSKDLGSVPVAKKTFTVGELTQLVLNLSEQDQATLINTVTQNITIEGAAPVDNSDIDSIDESLSQIGKASVPSNGSTTVPFPSTPPFTPVVVMEYVPPDVMVPFPTAAAVGFEDDDVED